MYLQKVDTVGARYFQLSYAFSENCLNLSVVQKGEMSFSASAFDTFGYFWYVSDSVLQEVFCDLWCCCLPDFKSFVPRTSKGMFLIFIATDWQDLDIFFHSDLKFAQFCRLMLGTFNDSTLAGLPLEIGRLESLTEWQARLTIDGWLTPKANDFWPRLDLSSNLLSELPESFWPSLAGFLKSCKVNKVKVILSHSCCLLRVLRFCEVLVICRSWWGHPWEIESYVQLWFMRYRKI